MEMTKPPKQAIWPNIIAGAKDGEKLTQVSRGKVWVELGLSHRSLMPFARSHNLWFLYDRRRWSYAFVSRLHSPVARSVFLSLRETHLRHRFDPSVVREMARICSGMTDDKDVGVALFVLWATGGVTNLASTIERAVNCSNSPEDLPTVFERHASVIPLVLPSAMDDEECVRKIVEDMKVSGVDEYHLNVNWTKMHPSPERIKAIADSLCRRGITWSFMFIDRMVARDVADEYKAAKIGSTIYVIGEPS